MAKEQYGFCKGSEKPSGLQQDQMAKPSTYFAKHII